MKKIITQSQRTSLAILITLFLFVFGYTQSRAQPTWGGGAIVPSGPNKTALTFSTWHNIQTINCDMYTDASDATGPGHSVVVVVWDAEITPGNWAVFANLYDPANTLNPYFWNWEFIGTGRNPDVAIGDRNQNPSSFGVAIVYENTTGTSTAVTYKEYSFSGMFGGTQFVNPNPITVDISFATSPHIDALPRVFGSSPTTKWWPSTLPGTPNTSYEPLRDYVISWTWNLGGTNKIYYNFEQFNTVPDPLNAVFVADGTESDIAGVLRNGTDEIAYLTYIDPNGDLVQEEWDIATSTKIGVTNTLESTLPIVGKPRIDARNVDNSSTSPLWAVISAVDIGGTNNEKIRYWDDASGMVDFALNDPLDPSGLDELGYRPAIGTGPGPDNYNMGVYGSQYGDEQYIMGYAVSNNSGSTSCTTGKHSIVATDNGFNPFGQYHYVDCFLFSNDRPSAYGSSSNCGVGNITAWTDDDPGGDIIFINMTQGNTMSYKPGKPTSIVNTKNNVGYQASPNPGTDFVIVQGLKQDATYIAKDITGRAVLQGVAGPFKQRIDIAQLSSGVYIFNFNENGVVSQLKLVKQ